MRNRVYRSLLLLIGTLLVSQSASAAAGRTAGTFNVSSTGAATYTIPIDIPHGTRGVQPNISLAYNSSAGVSDLGPGWSIAGLSAISRCQKTMAQEGDSAPIALNAADAYCLDGQKLILTSGTQGSNGSTYKTEQNQFSRITAWVDGSVAYGSGPTYFAVEGKDGLTYTYGDAVGGTGASDTVGGATFRWLLASVQDRNGNGYWIIYGDGYSSVRGSPARIATTSTNATTVTFEYGTRTAANLASEYVAGYSVSSANQLIGITTATNRYKLTYETGTATSRSRLSSIQKCTVTTPEDCLSPTVITYQNGQAGVSTSTASPIPSSAVLIGAYDINGDARSDLVYSQAGSVFVTLATTIGYGAPINTGIASGSEIIYRDLLGNGKTGLFTKLGSTWYYYQWNGSSFSTTSVVADPFAGTAHQVTLADVDGDGRPDLVYLQQNYSSQDNYFYARLNNSSGSVASFSATPITIAYWGGPGIPSYGSITLAFAIPARGEDIGRKGIVDVNADGREDLAVHWAGGYWTYNDEGSAYNIPEGSFLLVTSGTSTDPTLGVANGFGYGDLTIVSEFEVSWSLQYGHFNSDACTDIMTGSAVYISGCNGNNGQVISFFQYGIQYVADWDGDGLDDVFRNASTVYLARGSGFSAATATGFQNTAGVVTLVTMDQNGDGLDDFAFADWTRASVSYGLHNGSGVTPDLATSIKDGFGVEYKPSYVALARAPNFTPSTNAAYPYRDYTGTFNVVDTVSMPDGRGAFYAQQMAYAGAWVNLQGRGFTGFQSVTRSDDRADSLVEKFYFKTDFPYIGMLHQQDTYQHNGTTLVSRTTNALNYNAADGFAYVAGSSTDSYEVGGNKNGLLVAQSNATYSFDSYGNLTSATTTVTDKDNAAPTSPTFNQSWTTTVTNTFVPNLSNWCVGLPTQSVTGYSANNGELGVNRTVNFANDYAYCRATQQTVAPGTAYQVITDFGYDSYGNVNSQTVTGNAMAARTTTTLWGGSGRFPYSITNALNQTTLIGFDYEKGVQTSQTDPNGITTSWQYDSFGRKTLESRQDGTSTTWSYSLCSGCDPLPRLVVVEQPRDTGGAPITTRTSYLDMMDRLIYQSSQLLGGSTAWTTLRSYDSLGRVLSESFPYSAAGASSGAMTYSYDALNRVTQAQRPISASVSATQSTLVQYLGRTTITTDAEGKQATKATDVNGRLRRSQDQNGYYQNFGYDAFGSLKSVTDSQSNPLFLANYVYGLQAFQTSTHDMDLGDWGYTPNALGEVVAYTDNKQVGFNTTYDALSRPLTRNEPDNITTWTWGNNATLHNIGQLQSVTSSNGTSGTTENFSYDTSGRLSQRDINADGTTYSYNNTYNSLGLLETLTYPASGGGYRLKLQYLYQSGFLQQIKDYNASTIFWQANAMNPRGQFTQEQLGNGIIVNRSYDAVTGWIDYIRCGVGGGACSQNNSYTFDKVGNLTQRQNANLNLTENFFYDSVNRLDYSQLNGQTNLDMTYDNLGNITNRTDVSNNATWTYDLTRKHQVLTAGGNSYAYDQNGNVTSRNGSSISWTSYNYPSQINGPGETINLFYDANRQRYKQVYNYNGNVETTFYIGGLTQKVSMNGNDDYRYTITANGKTVAIMSCGTGHVCANGPSNLTRYVLSDNQGSVAKFTDSSGNAIVSESFTAFGARRNPQTWSGQPTYGDQQTISGISREGYTGHTALGSLGLNHMNGRVQDAVTGRFLSADPYITEPGNTQNYNRYSYVYNNPLSFTDPTGFCGEDNSPHIGQCTDNFTFVNGMLAGGSCLFVIGNNCYNGPGDDSPIDIGHGWAIIGIGRTAQDLKPYGYWTFISPQGPGVLDSGPDDPATPSNPQTPEVVPVIVQMPQTQNGHDYRTQNPVCRRALTGSERQDLLNRFAIPSVFRAGERNSNGEYLVTNSWGLPGGIVQTTFSADGLAATNVTTPVHAFVGVIDRSIHNSPNGAYIATHGYGTAPRVPGISSSLGIVRDQANQVFGPMIFDSLDAKAQAFASANYPGC